MSFARMVDILQPRSSGAWTLERFTITPGFSHMTAIRAASNRRKGDFVAAGDYMRLTHKGTVVMSDTDNEKATCRTATVNLRGHALVGGLGMGMILTDLRPQVKSVTIIEKSSDVIDMVADQILPHVKVPCKIVRGDIFDWKTHAEEHFSSAWFDIWNTVSDLNVKEMDTLRSNWSGIVSGWIGCWCERECRNFVEDIRRRLRASKQDPMVALANLMRRAQQYMPKDTQS